jgi:predicted enzyme related to lactoylglutathione lyase
MTDTNTGRFVWFELMTTDPKAAIAFYSEVIGWHAQPWESGEYTMWVGSQGPLGGVMTLPEQAKAMGAPPHWMANVQVASVDAAVEQVRARGGQVFVPPQDVPKVGRFAVIADPQGASISLFTPSGEMQGHDPTKQGEFSWHELITTDHEAAFRFYNELFGWEKLGEFDMGPMGVYLLYGRNGKQLGGMFTKSKDMPMPPSWLYYVTIDDLDAALHRAKGKGARVLHGPVEVPGGQRIVQLMDPQGAAFALVTPPSAGAAA